MDLVTSSLIDCSAGYPYQYDDGGRSLSKRPRQRNDCTVIALAIVVDQPYDKVYEMLKAHGRGCSDGFQIREFLDKYRIYGKRFAWTPFNAVKGQQRMRPPEFCRRYPQGRYIAYTAKHVTAVVNGVWRDTFVSRPDRCIYAMHGVVS